jgi:hypothetical protein
MSPPALVPATDRLQGRRAGKPESRQTAKVRAGAPPPYGIDGGHGDPQAFVSLLSKPTLHPPGLTPHESSSLPSRRRNAGRCPWPGELRPFPSRSPARPRLVRLPAPLISAQAQSAPRSRRPSGACIPVIELKEDAPGSRRHLAPSTFAPAVHGDVGVVFFGSGDCGSIGRSKESIRRIARAKAECLTICSRGMSISVLLQRGTFGVPGMPMAEVGGASAFARLTHGCRRKGRAPS